MLSEINQTEKDKYLLLTCRNYKIQQTSEYNEKKIRLTDIENEWLPVGRGEGQYGGGCVSGTNCYI